MSYEVDLMTVGSGSKSGDAMALRFGDFVVNPQDQKVVVIDGGFQESGEKLVERIRNEYRTNRVDLVISTHPDQDHLSGLHVILEEMEVGELWMHRPWNMSTRIKSLAEENRGATMRELSDQKIKKSLELAYDLEKLASRKGVNIVDPFQGVNKFDNQIHVLGPERDFYCQLVSKFGEPTNRSLLNKIKSLISEVWHRDELVDPQDDEVSARNNSSVILLARFGEDHFLFTGDAGVLALNSAADYADEEGYDIASNVKFFQVPHHGSKRNIGPTLLNRLIGPILPEGEKTEKTAVISACSDSEKHPSKKVLNAFLRRGVNVSEWGGNHCYRSLDVPMRHGWGPLTPVNFFHSYED